MPTAEDTEKRPPTQSQKPKALTGSIPNSPTAFRLVLRQRQQLSWSRFQFRALALRADQRHMLHPPSHEPTTPPTHLTAIMCLPTASAPRCCVSQARTVRALSIVSAVVKVLLQRRVREGVGVGAGNGAPGWAGRQAKQPSDAWSLA